MVDLDGKVVYSKVVSVIYNERSAVTIYPNPTHDYIDISAPAKIISIEITDISGKTVKKIEHEGNQHYSINDLKKGLYTIKVFYDKQVSVSKLMVQ